MNPDISLNALYNPDGSLKGLQVSMPNATPAQIQEAMRMLIRAGLPPEPHRDPAETYVLPQPDPLTGPMPNSGPWTH